MKFLHSGILVAALLACSSSFLVLAADERQVRLYSHVCMCVTLVDCWHWLHLQRRYHSMGLTFSRIIIETVLTTPPHPASKPAVCLHNPSPDASDYVGPVEVGPCRGTRQRRHPRQRRRPSRSARRRAWQPPHGIRPRTSPPGRQEIEGVSLCRRETPCSHRYRQERLASRSCQPRRRLSVQ